MPNLSIKDVPEALAEKLRQRASRHHRSLQGELMAIVEAAVGEESAAPAGRGHLLDQLDALSAANRRLGADREARLARLREIADSADASFQATERLTREEANDRAQLRRLGI